MFKTQNCFYIKKKRREVKLGYNKHSASIAHSNTLFTTGQKKTELLRTVPVKHMRDGGKALI